MSDKRQSRPAFSPEERQDVAAKLLAHVLDRAPQLLRAPKGILAHPRIALSPPGRPYSEAMWDWDTLLSAQGLFDCARMAGDQALRDRVGEHTLGSWLNFFEHQSADGRVPIMVSETEADPFRCLEPAPSPNHRNQAKPVFGRLAELISDETGDVSWLAPRFDGLLRFYEYWIANNMSRAGLLVWGDDVAIGNDNDPATFGRPFFSSANLLLNTLYYQDLKASSGLAARLGRPSDAEMLSSRAEDIGASILRECWDPRDNFFYTVDTQCVDRRAELIKYPRGMDMSWQCLPLKVQSFTGFLPLWCGLATPEQASDLVKANYLADERFRADWGVRSLSSLERMYCMDFSSNPSNWLGPVWIIVNYVVWRALGNYGFTREADDLADKTIRLMAAGLGAQGCFNEYYHPDTGAPLSHTDYMDWNMLVLEMI